MDQSYKPIFVVIGPFLSLLVWFICQFTAIPSDASLVIAVTTLTVFWWVSEALPIPATALVPFVLLPLFNIISHKTAASALGSHVILLLMGAFMLSKGIENSGVHRRLALYILHAVDSNSAHKLVLGFTLTSGLLSMWVSNTATTLMMLPIAMAFIQSCQNPRLSVALILGIAYGASLGGIGSPLGTPPNVIFMGIYEEITHNEFSFAKWISVGLPVVLLGLPVVSFWLTRKVKLKTAITLPDPGPWRTAERNALAIFTVAIVLWLTRNAPFGGWSALFDRQLVGDSSIALAAALAMFMAPNGKGGQILDWQSAKTIPWGILLLFAGGIVLAKGFDASGLSALIGAGFAHATELHPLLLMLCITLCVTLLTEVISNTATATLLMPILGAIALSVGLPPETLMIPAAMAASCAFMLPVATAPNSIAYGTGLVTMKDMVREGALLSIGLAVLIAFVCYWRLF